MLPVPPAILARLAQHDPEARMLLTRGRTQGGEDPVLRMPVVILGGEADDPFAPRLVRGDPTALRPVPVARPLATWAGHAQDGRMVEHPLFLRTAIRRGHVHAAAPVQFDRSRAPQALAGAEHRAGLQAQTRPQLVHPLRREHGGVPLRRGG